MRDPMDIIGFGGLILVGAGVGARYGWPIGLIVVGVVLLLTYAYVELFLPSRGGRRG